MTGKLIADTQPAAPCCPGPLQYALTCAYVNAQWTSQTFQSDTPLGYSYPNDSCPVVTFAAGAKFPSACAIGDQP